MELVEHLARIALVANQLGGVRPLPADVLPALLQARARRDLGKTRPSDDLTAVCGSGQKDGGRVRAAAAP